VAKYILIYRFKFASFWTEEQERYNYADIILKTLQTEERLSLYSIFYDGKKAYAIFTFMLPCIVTDFFSNNRFQAESGWNSAPSWLCLETVIKNLHETY
jgi:hypothetical protein